MSVLTSSRDVEHLYPQWRNILEKGHTVAAIRNIEAGKLWKTVDQFGGGKVLPGATGGT